MTASAAPSLQLVSPAAAPADETLYREALLRMPAATYTTDAEGRITFYNEAAAQLWGRRPKIGPELWCGSYRIYYPDGSEVPLDTCPMAQAIKQGRAILRAEIVVERPDGQRRQVLAHPQPVHDANGRLIGAINVLVDVTELKAAQAQLAQTSEDLASEVRTLTSLHELVMQLAGMTDLRVALQAILEAIVRIARADFGLMWLYEGERGCLRPAASVGFDADGLQRFSSVMPGPAGGANGNAFANRQRVVIEDVESDPRFDGFRDAAAKVGFRAVHSTPMFNRDGEPIGALSVHFRTPHVPVRSELQFADMCARHAAEVVEAMRTREALRNSERLYRAIGESIDYGVWVCDPEGRNVYASESFLRLVGLTQAQCNHFGWTEALHPDDVQPTLAAWQACVAAGCDWYRELRFRGVDGRWHPVLSRGMPVRGDDGAITAWTGIHLDINRMKQVEHELRTADQRKDEFLATLAHELRNPLAPISNALQVLKRTTEPARVEHTRGIMERQLQQMVRLIDDLLDVSRISLGKIELQRERLDLRAVLASAIEASLPLINAAGHQLTLDLPDEPVFVNGDATRLAQVFANLLNNAARYTPRHGHIALSVRMRPDEAVVVVCDDGIGIPADMLASVFEMFVQGSSKLEGSRGGLGIGLTLVKRLVELHGGTVRAFSEPDRGSELLVTLPRAVEPAQEAPAPGAAAQAGGGLRVLIVDDNRDAAETLAMLLELLGHDIRLAHDGVQALEVADEFHPHAVLLDIGMPRLDGYAVCSRLRTQPWARDALLIAVTGWGQERDQRRSRDVGFDAHLVKPVEPKALQDLLGQLEKRFSR